MQRVDRAAVSVAGEEVAAIGRGYVALVGICDGDTFETVEQLARKVAQIRLFPTPDAPKDKPIDAALDVVDGDVLAVSQFTLCADTSKGRRPSFVKAADPEHAEPLFDAFVAALREADVSVATGVFGAHMQIELVNDGPVTIVLDA